MSSKRNLFFYLLCISLSFSGCAHSSKSSQKTIRGSLSDKEIDLGSSIHKTILSQYYLYTEPELNEYVHTVMNRVAAVADREMNYEIFVLISDKAYATSAPGGHLYITTAFIDFLQNEAELAAVISHEIGQLQYLDPRLNRWKPIASGLEIVTGIIGGLFGILGVVSFLAVQAINSAAFHEKSGARKISDADGKTLEYLAAAGYDPQSWVDVLYRITQLETSNLFFVVDYLNLRPITSERVASLDDYFKDLYLGRGEYHTFPREFLDETKGVRQMYRVA